MIKWYKKLLCTHKETSGLCVPVNEHLRFRKMWCVDCGKETESDFYILKDGIEVKGRDFQFPKKRG